MRIRTKAGNTCTMCTAHRQVCLQTSAAQHSFSIFQFEYDGLRKRLMIRRWQSHWGAFPSLALIYHHFIYDPFNCRVWHSSLLWWLIRKRSQSYANENISVLLSWEMNAFVSPRESRISENTLPWRHLTADRTKCRGSHGREYSGQANRISFISHFKARLLQTVVIVLWVWRLRTHPAAGGFLPPCCSDRS